MLRLFQGTFKYFEPQTRKIPCACHPHSKSQFPPLPVHIESNFVGVHPVGSVERWCSNEKARKELICPRIVIFSNKGMGGVDLADMLIALYWIAVETKGWYLKMSWHWVDIAKVSAWLFYRRHCDQLGIAKKNQISNKLISSLQKP